MTNDRKASICFVILFVLMVVAIVFLWHVSKAEATVTYVFGSTAAKDGTIITSVQPGICPPASWRVATVNKTGITATAGTYWDGTDYSVAERGFLSCNTSVLAGKTVLNAYWKLVVHDKYNYDWNTDVQFNFRQSCISTSLAAVDTACFATVDTTISWASIPAVHDTATGCIIPVRSDLVSTTGNTELIIRSSKEIDICDLNTEHEFATLSDVQFYTVEITTANWRPRLYVTVADDAPAATATVIQYFPDEEED